MPNLKSRTLKNLNDQPAEVFVLKVMPGDLIYADRYGAVVIPDEFVLGLQPGIREVTCYREAGT
jgi:hypothetical protein